MASAAYTEQVGSNRHAGGMKGEMNRFQKRAGEATIFQSRFLPLILPQFLQFKSGT